jgi:hypothetical protein
MHENLKENQHRLVTHFDLHYTLRNIATLPESPPELSKISYAREYFLVFEKKARARWERFRFRLLIIFLESLFDPISEDRTCDDAGA